MATRPGRKISRPTSRGPRKAGRAVGNAVALHEAIIICMVRENEYTMTLGKLVRLNKDHGLYKRPTDGKYPDYIQMRARVVMAEYRQFFEVEDRGAERAKVRLRQFGDAVGLNL